MIRGDHIGAIIGTEMGKFQGESAELGGGIRVISVGRIITKNFEVDDILQQRLVLNEFYDWPFTNVRERRIHMLNYVCIYACM